MPTISRRAEYKLTERRSRFFAVAMPAETQSEVKRAVESRRTALRKARHHVWACRIRAADGSLFEQARDDGEVGRPGMVLLELLRRADLEGALVVSRISGGVKLGPGGVARAFRSAGEGALQILFPVGGQG